MSNHCYLLNDSKQTLFDAQLLYITEAKYEDDWINTPHTHNFTELFYVLDGEGHFSVNNANFPIRENDLIIVNSGVMHTEYSTTDAPLHYIVIGVDSLRLHTKTHSDYYLHNFHEEGQEFSFCFRALMKEITDKNSNYESVLQNYFNILMEYILRKINATLTATPSSSAKLSKECRFIEQYLHEHFHEDITLQTLSDLTYMNKHYLAHTFKKYKGISPIAYLTQIRVKEAKFLLESTDYSVSKIAATTGFSSQSYFSQVFKKETGISANEYRKRFL